MALRRNIYSPSYYNSTSSAYDYDYDRREIYEGEDKRKANSIKLKREALAEKKAGRAHGLKLICALMFVFSGCIVTMASYAAVDGQRVSNNALKTELSTLKNQNSELQAKIADETDLTYIEQEARGRLGMTEPQPYQLVYISVPQQSYTVQYEAGSEEQEEGFGPDEFVNTLKDILNIE